jgi:hypothetical protein
MRIALLVAVTIPLSFNLLGATDNVGKADSPKVRVLPLPTNQSIPKYFHQNLWLELQYLISEPIDTSQGLEAKMLPHLSASERQTIAKLFNADPEDNNALKLPFRTLEGRRIRFDRSHTTIEKKSQEGSETNPQKSLWTRDSELEEEFKKETGYTKRGRMIVFACYDKGRYTILKSDFTKDSLWLFPLNKQSVRYLGHFHDEGFCDKSYEDYYKSFIDAQNESQAPLLWLIYETLLKGYNPESFKLLPRKEQKLIHDTIGIFLAEELRMKTRGDQEKLLHISPGSLLIASYVIFSRNPSSDPKENESFEKELITALPKSHREFVKNLPYYDEKISSYLIKHHPTLYQNLRTEFGISQKRTEDVKILRKILKRLEDKDLDVSTSLLDTLKEFTLVLKNEATKM